MDNLPVLYSAEDAETLEGFRSLRRRLKKWGRSAKKGVRRYSRPSALTRMIRRETPLQKLRRKRRLARKLKSTLKKRPIASGLKYSGFRPPKSISYLARKRKITKARKTANSFDVAKQMREHLKRVEIAKAAAKKAALLKAAKEAAKVTQNTPVINKPVKRVAPVVTKPIIKKVVNAPKQMAPQPAYIVRQPALVQRTPPTVINLTAPAPTILNAPKPEPKQITKAAPKDEPKQGANIAPIAAAIAAALLIGG